MSHHSHHKTAMSHHKSTKPRHKTRHSHDQSLVKSILTAPFKIWGRLVLHSPESSLLQNANHPSLQQLPRRSGSWLLQGPEIIQNKTRNYDIVIITAEYHLHNCCREQMNINNTKQTGINLERRGVADRPCRRQRYIIQPSLSQGAKPYGPRSTSFWGCKGRRTTVGPGSLEIMSKEWGSRCLDVEGHGIRLGWCLSPKGPGTAVRVVALSAGSCTRGRETRRTVGDKGGGHEWLGFDDERESMPVCLVLWRETDPVVFINSR